MYVLFDTETTDLPLDYKKPISDLVNWGRARMVQIAWIEYDENGNKTAAHDYIIKPDGFTIPMKSIEIHRITNELANEKGVPVKKALALFREAIARNKYLIAHNIDFDKCVVGSEYVRSGQDNPLDGIFQICTMKLTTDFVRAKNPWGGKGYKWPNLSELHMKLFGVKFDDAHDALVDTEALGRCFFKLQELGVLGFKGAADKKPAFADATAPEVPQEELFKPMVNFGVHTFFSIMRGAGSIDDYVKRGKELGHPAMVITDRGNVSGSLEFFRKCKAAGMKPILGCELNLNNNIGKVQDPSDEGASYIQKIIVKDREGFVNLNKLLYLSHTKGFRGGESRITTDWLIENRGGLMVSTGGHEGYISDLVTKGRRQEAEAYFDLLHASFGDDLFSELRFNETQEQRSLNEFILITALKNKVPVVLDNDVHYVRSEDNALQDVVFTMAQQGASLKKAKLFDRRRLFFPNRKNYMDLNKGLGYFYPEKNLESFMDNSLVLAERCNFEFEMGVEKYPVYEPTQDVIDFFKTSSPEEIIYKMSAAKLRKKLKEREKRIGKEMTDQERQVYFDRLQYELDVIKSKNALDYFLVNWEILRDYRSKGYETGAGRGSAAGCLLSWALDITKIDPLMFGLYFERFMNPTRQSMPDIDCDVMSGTDHVIDEFLFAKYGKERILSVGTISTFSEKNTLKDVVRAHYGAEFTGTESEVNLVCKEMPNWLKVKDFTLKDWFERHPTTDQCGPVVKRWLEDPKNAIILEQTLKLQGQARGFGKHAAGVVITPKESWCDVPTSIIPKQQSLVTAFSEADGSNKDLSALGILKLDRLKLSTMNVIMDAIEIIKKTEGKDITDIIMHIDEGFDDPNLYSELRLGLNHGVFQFESAGINALIRGIKIESFDEVVAANALFRPGPMGINAHKEYIHNKFNPNETKAAHPALEPILAETNGVMIYQEQVQFIAKEIAGMDLGEGDMLRRYMDKASKIISKKSSGESLDEKEEKDKDYQSFLKYWDKLLKGAAERGFSETDVNKIRDYMIKYLGYSFNKCLGANNTVITETRGEINLLEVKIGERILGYNPDTYQDEFVSVKAIHHNGKKMVHKFTTYYGHTLECTMDHKVLTMSGMRSIHDILHGPLPNSMGLDSHVYRDMKVLPKDLERDSLITYAGIDTFKQLNEVETYDLEIDSPHHNFYANGICVSNSHSVSYGFIAMQTLYLKHYHPTAFYTALLNNASGSGDKEDEQAWMENTIASAISKGIAVKPPSRKSKWECSVTADHEITLGFSMINGFGEVAHAELMDLISMKKGLDTMSMTAFFELPFSKFNKSAFEACLKAGVFDDWSNSRDYLLFLKTKKKKKAIDPKQTTAFDMEEISIGVRMDDTKYQPMTEEERLAQFIEVCGFDIRHIERVANIKKSIQKKGASVEAVTSFHGDDSYYFFLNDIRYLKTKDNKDYLQLIVGDGISKTKLHVFEPMVDKIAPELERNAVYLTQFVKNEKGFINMKRNCKFKKIVHAYADEVAA